MAVWWSRRCASRARSRDEVFRTIIRHVYRVSGDTLTLERSARAVRPNEPPSEKWAPIGKVTYSQRKAIVGSTEIARRMGKSAAVSGHEREEE